MKILALDIGDRWTGIAISDPLGIIARPYDTVATHQLIDVLERIITLENISTIVVGMPITLRGLESEQTKKVKTFTQELKQTFKTISWALWDERFTSKEAEKLKKARTKEEKLKLHAIAAAFILETYLMHIRLVKKNI